MPWLPGSGFLVRSHDQTLLVKVKPLTCFHLGDSTLQSETAVNPEVFVGEPVYVLYSKLLFRTFVHQSDSPAQLHAGTCLFHVIWNAVEARSKRWSAVVLQPAKSYSQTISDFR